MSLYLENLKLNSIPKVKAHRQIPPRRRVWDENIHDRIHKKNTGRLHYQTKKKQYTKNCRYSVEQLFATSRICKKPRLRIYTKQFGIEYVSIKSLAPNKALLDKYRKDKNWKEYADNFKALMNTRNARKTLDDLQLDKKTSCFLCSEDKPEKCHRRLVAEMLDKNFEIVHL